MKRIKLSQDKFALVDENLFEELNKYKWMAKNDKKNCYAARHSSEGTRKLIFMHRIIMNTPVGMFTDHVDGDGLNNQKYNLRTCTNLQNSRNRGKNRNNTSGFKGVSWHEEAKKWRALIAVKGKQKSLGLFIIKLEAYQAYCDACVKYHGDFAKF